MNRYRTIIAALSMLALCLPLSSEVTADWYQYRDSIEVEVISDSGREFPQYNAGKRRHRSAVQRAYLEAERGARYAIRVHNNSSERLGLVVAVDGRNIVSGEKSQLDNSERMYVLRPGESNVYRGWRTARNRVNRFYFTEAEDSYAEAFDDRSAMGVIAVAAYREQRSLSPYRTWESEPGGSADMRPRSRAQQSMRPDASESEAGTGFGKGERSPTRRVQFDPEDRAWRKVFLKYEWPETLCEMGITQCRPASRENRFWPEPWNGGYAPYPPAYRPDYSPRR